MHIEKSCQMAHPNILVGRTTNRPIPTVASSLDSLKTQGDKEGIRREEAAGRKRYGDYLIDCYGAAQDTGGSGGSKEIR